MSVGAKVEDEDQDRRSKMDKEEEGGRDEADLICSALLCSAQLLRLDPQSAYPQSNTWMWVWKWT